MRAVIAAALGLLALLIALPAAAQRLEPLPPEQAFRFAAAMDGEEVVVTYTMPDGLYLYQNRLQLTVAAGAGAQIGELRLPPGSAHEDEFFGRTTVYYHGVTLRAAVRGGGDFQLLARSQGCDEQVGICYPPQENTALLTAPGGGAAADGGEYSKDEAGYLSRGIAANSIFWTVAIFFALGVGLSFTPCVLPMIPILLGVIGGGGKSRRRILALTAAYIAGMALAFTGFGIAAAAAGQLLAAALQQPWLLGGVALLFVLLAASLFGAYELQPPAALRRRLAAAGGGGSGGGAFVMGVVSAVAVSPCVAAPLIGALLYIGKSGDVVRGGLALLSLALGMSVLLAVAGVAGARLLPQAGRWTERVKRLFGALLLFVAVWVASPLLAAPAQLLLYGLLLLLTGLLLLPPAGGGEEAPVTTPLLRAPAAAALLWGAAMLIGAAAGSRDVLTPLSPFVRSVSEDGERGGGGAAAQFQPVATLAQLRQITAAADAPVMLDFYADWCVSCKEFERFTLRDARVADKLQNTVLLRADVTHNTPDDRALLAHFNLYGPPAILFFRAGDLITDVRVIGYENADDFLTTLAAAGI